MNPAEPITLGLIAEVAAGIGFAVGIVLYVSKRFADSDKALAEHKLHAAETFATKDGMREGFAQISNTLDRLSSRVDELIRIERRKEQ